MEDKWHILVIVLIIAALLGICVKATIDCNNAHCQHGQPRLTHEGCFCIEEAQ